MCFRAHNVSAQEVNAPNVVRPQALATLAVLPKEDREDNFAALRNLLYTQHVERQVTVFRMPVSRPRAAQHQQSYRHTWRMYPPVAKAWRRRSHLSAPMSGRRIVSWKS